MHRESIRDIERKKREGIEINPDLVFPDRIYGRNKEIELFNEILQSFREKEFLVLQLLGEAGIGKSYFLNKLIKQRSEFSIYYGKYERFQRGVPYLGVRRIVESIVKKYKKQGEESYEKFASEMRFRFSDSYSEFASIVPSISEIWDVTDQNKESNNSPKALQNRINQALTSFFHFIVSYEDDPIVLCLDDLQWCDKSSQNFIINLANHEIKGLMLILSSRSIPYADSSTPDKFYDDIGQLNHLEQLALSPLSRKEVGNILDELFPNAIGDKIELRDFVYDSSTGNPYRLNESLSELNRSGKIIYRSETNQWDWNLENEFQLHGERPIAGMLKDKLLDLKDEYQKILQLSSCFGTNLNVPFICKIIGVDEHVVRSTFQQSVSLGFLVTADIAGQEGMVQVSNFQFVHEIAQETVRSSLDEKERQDIHKRIGKYYCDGTFIGLADRDVFEAAYHLNESVNENWSSEDLHNHALVNFRAMQQTHSAASFSLAHTYLENLILFEKHKNWKYHYDFSSKAHILGYQIAMLNDQSDLSAKLFKEGIEKMDAVERSKLRLTKTMLHIQFGELQAALNEGTSALKDLGINVPKKAGILHVGREFVKTKFMLRKRSLEDIYNLPPMKDKKIENAFEIIFWMFRAAYHINPELNGVLALKKLQLMLIHGTNGEAYSSLMAYGVIIGAASNNCKDAYAYSHLGSRIADKYKFTSGQLEFGRAIYSAYKIPLRDTLRMYETAKVLSYQSGDFLAAAEPSANESLTLLAVGTPLAGVEIKVKENMEYCKNLYASDYFEFQKVLLYRVKMLKGEKLHQHELEDLENLMNTSEFNFLVATQIVLQMQIEALKGNWSQVIEIANKGRKKMQFLTGLYAQTEYSFYKALALCKQYHSYGAFDKWKANRAIKKIHQNISRWAECAPETHLHRLRIIEGLMAQKNGQLKEAQLKLNEAFELAKKSAFTQNAALSQWFLFDVHEQNGDDSKAREAYQKSLELFGIWGTKIIG